jgi:hypothetical protein
MTAKQLIENVVEELTEDQLRELAEFAQFLHWRKDREQWQQFGREQFARAYGPDEPEYGFEDLEAGPRQ